MWINKHLKPLVALMAMSLCGITTVVEAADDNKVPPSNIIQILSKDAMSTTTNKPPQLGEHQEGDMKPAGTVTNTNSEPAPEFYRGIPATDPLRAYDRYGVGAEKGSWLSLDKESLYKNPYIQNAYNKLAQGGALTPSVSSLMSPNASYRDRYDQYNYNTASSDYLNNNNKYGYGNTYNGYTNGYGSTYGPAQALDYNHYGGGSSSIFDTGYGNRYGHNSILGENNIYGGHYNKFGGDYLSSKFGKSTLLPLAGAALLGVAATLVANPLLLNFGVGKRKRRSIEDQQDELQAKDNAQEKAYRGYRV